MSFTDVETVLSATLPPSARRYRAYWCNANPLGRAIRDAGWKPDQVDLVAERVDFARELTTRS